jgi:hypothetical protein
MLLTSFILFLVFGYLPVVLLLFGARRRLNIVVNNYIELRQEYNKTKELADLCAKYVVKQHGGSDEDEEEDDEEDDEEDEYEEEYVPSSSYRREPTSNRSYSQPERKQENVSYIIERMPPPYRLGYMNAGYSSDEISAINKAQSVSRFHPEDKVRVVEVCGSRKCSIWSN